ncbi:MAG: hypothetical protein QXH71_02505 [Candidatus Anstonellaceae archaeon]
MYVKQQSSFLSILEEALYYKDYKKIKDIFEQLTNEEKSKACEDFIKFKNQICKNADKAQKEFLITVANILNPFYSSQEAKRLASLPEQQARKETGKYNYHTNNCRHFVFNLSKKLYEGLIEPKDLDWKKTKKTSNPQISRGKEKERPIHYDEVYRAILSKDNLSLQNFEEGDIIWIKRKNGTYHVGIVVKFDENNFEVVDFTGKVNRKSIKEFTKNTIELKIFRIKENNKESF